MSTINKCFILDAYNPVKLIYVCVIGAITFFIETIFIFLFLLFFKSYETRLFVKKSPMIFSCFVCYMKNNDIIYIIVL